VDVSEIRFETLACEVAQRDERFLTAMSVLAKVPLNLGVSAGIPVLVAKATVDLSGSVALLGRGRLVVDQDLIDDRLERPQFGSEPIPYQRLGMGVSMLECMPNDST
jgi:hypothetical protein